MRTIAPGLAVALGVALGSATPASAAVPECAGILVQVTPACVDPLYAQPVIDDEQDLTTPIVHRRVSGHFEDTSVRFTIYLPPRAQWQGRFFQYTYPTSDENALDRAVAFAAASGAYTVQASGTGGYRHDAAAAKFAEQVAAAYYRSGDRRIYGYLYGPSGGSFQTVGAMENTTGVWEGAVPIVLGVPTSIPINFFVRAQARLVLRDVADKIADAVLPGGSGNPYAGLTSVQAAALREATNLGVPLKAWQDPDYVLGLSTTDGLLGFGALIRHLDPTYVTDFWSKPGYLGTEQSALGDVVRTALIDTDATVTEVTSTSITLAGVPKLTSAFGLDFTTDAGSLTGTLDPVTGVLTLDSVPSSLVVGAEVHVDNRWFVALPSYYRHQIPPSDQGYTVFDAFRGKYPQRSMLVGALITDGVSGGAGYTGKISGKMIVVDNLVDSDAYPWHPAWYAQRVWAALGAKAYENGFRLYYNDNADHLEGPVAGAKTNRIVSYDPIVEQALLDVAAWAERGTTPPASTRYTVTSGQVTVPAAASQRRGIQPVVDLTVRGRDRIDVKAGQKVTFTAKVQVPPGAGTVVATSWDYTGSGNFATGTGSYRYTRPGTYYVSFRGATSRSGKVGPYAQIENLDRVRVVVHP